MNNWYLLCYLNNEKEESRITRNTQETEDTLFKLFSEDSKRVVNVYPIHREERNSIIGVTYGKH